MKPNRTSPRAAFTLVEILLAMAILGMIMTAIYSTWLSVMRAAKTGLDGAALAQEQRIAMRAVEEALSSTVYFEQNAALYAFETDTSMDTATLSFVSHLPPWFPGNGLYGGGGVRRVTFAVQPGANSPADLVM